MGGSGLSVSFRNLGLGPDPGRGDSSFDFHFDIKHSWDMTCRSTEVNPDPCANESALSTGVGVRMRRGQTEIISTRPGQPFFNLLFIQSLRAFRRTGSVIVYLFLKLLPR